MSHTLREILESTAKLNFLGSTADEVHTNVSNILKELGFEPDENQIKDFLDGVHNGMNQQDLHTVNADHVNFCLTSPSLKQSLLNLIRGQ